LSSYQGVGAQGQQQQKRNKALKKTITGAATHGGLIQITAVAHTFRDEDRITITGVGGTVEANAAWRVAFIDANHFDLKNSTFTNVYTSGGIATRTQG
jgi:hypothetical protein